MSRHFVFLSVDGCLKAGMDDLEGWHNSMKIAIRRHKPHIYTFIQAIRVEQNSLCDPGEQD